MLSKVLGHYNRRVSSMDSFTVNGELLDIEENKDETREAFYEDDFSELSLFLEGVDPVSGIEVIFAEEGDDDFLDLYEMNLRLANRKVDNSIPSASNPCFFFCPREGDDDYRPSYWA